MKKLILFFFACSTAFAQTEINCKITQVLPFDYFPGYSNSIDLIYKNNTICYLYIGIGGREEDLAAFDFKTNSMKKLKNLNRFDPMGRFENYILLFSKDKGNDTYKLYNPVTNEISELASKYPHCDLSKAGTYYQNKETFRIKYAPTSAHDPAEGTWQVDPHGYVLSKYNYETNVETDYLRFEPDLPKPNHASFMNGVFEFSSDRMHLLCGIYHLSIFRLPAFQKCELPSDLIHIAGEGSFVPFDKPTICLLTNNLVFLYFRSGVARVFTIDGGYIGEVKFKIEESAMLYDLVFSPDLTNALATLEKKGSNTKYGYSPVVIDTTGLRDWLDNKGLLWHARRGNIKAMKVNAYQNANIEAEIIGTYASGASIEVIDKSGGQDTFDGVTDYWYKVKSADGPEGWVFGGYLKIGAEIGKKYDATVSSIAATSMLTEKFDRNMYQPVKAFDGKPDTGWMESVPGPGIGEWIEIGFDQPVTADKLMVSPGWFDSRYWASNNRIKTMRIELDDFAIDISFKNYMTPQPVNLPGAKTFSRARFVVKEVGLLKNSVGIVL
jgi:hypothetical protein